MSFSDRLDAQLDEYRLRQKVRAWPLVTGLVAALYAAGIAWVAGQALFSAPFPEWLFIALWLGGAIYGAASLIAFGVIVDPSARQRRAFGIGLWAGNLVVCANTLVFPLILPLALIPVIGGFVVLSQRNAGLGKVYLGLPIASLGVTILGSYLSIPFGLDLMP